MATNEFHKRDTVVKRIKNNLNQINRDYFEGNHGILSVTDNSNYVTVNNRGVYLADYDTQKLFDALENFSQEDYKSRGCYDLWDYLDDCEYTLPENQESDNELKTDDELSFSEKQQVALVDMLLGEPAPTTETVALSDEIDNLKNQLMILSETVTQLCIRVYKLEEENKQLKNNQLEVETKSEPKPQPEPKPTTKKRPKFELPENFADYQQECDDLIEGLSCLYNIKKGKWNGNILQFILTPTASQKENYPDKWKAGLYLQPGQWTVDKVSMSDPDDWEAWFMDINDFADSNDIEIS
jgi:hypothetical protein